MMSQSEDQPQTSISYGDLTSSQQRQRLIELMTVFLRLGSTAFGGPAAHIAMIDDEVVNRRKWLSRETLLDLLGVTNLIPGPNSTELVIHIGYLRGGWRGLFIAGASFILPAMVLVWTLAFFYQRYQTIPQLNGLLYGIKPALMAILVQAVWLFSQKALKNPSTRFAAVFAIVGYFLRWNEVLLLGLMGTGVMLAKNIHLRTPQMKALILPLMGGTTGLPSVLGLFPFPHAVYWVDVFWIFLKIGSVLYGSGYVLLAFLQRELVEQRGWLTSQQMLDAVAIGQFTPGPVLTTATFIGYLLAGHPGAVAATTGIFLPAFILVWLVSPWVPKLRQSPWTSGFLDGLNAASLGLMVSVTITLSQSALVDFLTIGLAVISAIAILKFGINSAWLIIFGGLMGVGWGYLTNLL